MKQTLYVQTLSDVLIEIISTTCLTIPGLQSPDGAPKSIFSGKLKTEK